MTTLPDHIRAERPILFSAPMVRAILAGTKTQTRRIVKGAPDDWAPIGPEVFSPIVVDRHGDEQPGPDAYGAGNPDGDCWIRCPYGQPGDRLWVRETWRVGEKHDSTPPRGLPPQSMTVLYAAGGSAAHGSDGWRFDEEWPGDTIVPWAGKLRTSMFMPRWASRITLDITAVRVERLQDISARDIVSEGAIERAHNDQFGHNPVSRFDGKVYLDLRSLWRAGWESINGLDSWAANPWVWVVEFKRALENP